MYSKTTFNSITETIVLSLIKRYNTDSDFKQLTENKLHAVTVKMEDGTVLELEGKLIHVGDRVPVFVFTMDAPIHNYGFWAIDQFGVLLTGEIFYIDHHTNLSLLPPEYWVGGMLQLIRNIYIGKSVESFLASPLLSVVDATQNNYTEFKEVLDLSESKIWTEHQKMVIVEGTVTNEDFYRDSEVENPTLIPEDTPTGIYTESEAEPVTQK